MLAVVQSPSANAKNRFGLRPNPHLKQTRQHQTQPASVVQIQPTMVISNRSRQNFCLNLRGWAVPTKPLFELLEQVLVKQKWDEQDKGILRFWLDRGFGYAIGQLIEENVPLSMGLYQTLIRQEYPETSVICPLSCTYKDYVNLYDSVSHDQRAVLQETCRPNCSLKSTPFTNYDSAFCACLVDSDRSLCARLSGSDRDMIRKAVRNQETVYREYEYKTQRKMLSGDSVDAIEARKSAFVSMIASAVAPQ